MATTARLIDVAMPKVPEGVVLVLHGGASRGADLRVSPTQPSVLRMIPVARRTARTGRRRLAVFRLLNSTRGWDTRHTPVQDTRWALEQITERLGGVLPTCLVGHSLGGRAALLSAGAPGVRSVAALAPWVTAADVPRGLEGQRLLIVHGDRDRIARPERSAALARALAPHADVAYVSVRGGKHAMLARRDSFDGLAADWAAMTLLGAPPRGALERIAAGERWLEV